MLRDRCARLIGIFFAPLLGIAACDQQAPSEAEEAEFRSSLFPPGLGLGLDTDVGLHDIPDLEEIECLIWDLQGGRVYSGPAEKNEVIGTVTSRALVSPEGSVLCSLDDKGPVPQLRRGKNGPVLYSTLGWYVFDGETQLSFPPSGKQVSALLQSLRFTFAQDRVIEGTRWDGDTILWADDRVQFASPFRKLLIAALVDGECGSDGLAHHH